MPSTDPSADASVDVPAAAREGFPARRRPGNSAGITPERIVAAARGLDPETLTIQAVATQLGVDRKAVTYHVNDREGLLGLLAVDAFASGFDIDAVPEDAGWREAIRRFAAAMLDSLLASGALVGWFRFDEPADAAVLRPAEAVVERMVDAGFDETVAAQSMVMLSHVVLGHARDAVLARTEGGHPQNELFRRALGLSPPGQFGVLRRLDAARVSTYGDDQFAFAIDIVIRGLESLLGSGR